MTEQYDKLENQFTKIASSLSTEEENILWGYICVAEEMNYRLLEILLELSDLSR